MLRSIRSKALAGVLIFVVAEALGARPARAQFPVFFGDQVLTPFGQRNSDGSYRPGILRRWNNRALSRRGNAYSMPQYGTYTYPTPYPYTYRSPYPRTTTPRASTPPTYSRYYYPPAYSYSPYNGTTYRPYYGGAWR